MTKVTREQAVGTVTADGEILEGVCVVIPKKHKNGFQRGFYTMANDATGEVIDLVLQGKLQGKDVITLLALLEVLEWENWIRISQRALADRLKMAPPNVSRSMKALINNGIILVGPNIGTSKTYRLNPRFGWKGGYKEHRAALKERMTAANISGVIEGRDPNTMDMFSGKADAETGQ